jgi:hypothetical protein
MTDSDKEVRTLENINKERTHPTPCNDIISRFDRVEVLLKLLSRVHSRLVLVLKRLYSFNEIRTAIARQWRNSGCRWH